MFTKRIVITNNPMVHKKYSGKADVVYMENMTPYDVYSEAKKQIQNGARLIKPYIKNPTSYYSTVCLFFGDEKAPCKGNLREIDAAVKRTYKLSHYYKEPAITPPFTMSAQLADYRASKIKIYDSETELKRDYASGQPKGKGSANAYVA